MKKVIYFLLALCFTQPAWSQKRSCGSGEIYKSAFRNDPNFSQREAAFDRYVEQYARQQEAQRTNIIGPIIIPNIPFFTIPVVVHVLYNSNATNISDAQIMSQFTVLNNDYLMANTDTANTPAAFRAARGNARLNFCLARRTPTGDPTTGIVRKRTAKAIFSFEAADAASSANGGDDAWDPTKYLNVWIVPDVTIGGNSIFGYGLWPGAGTATHDGAVIHYRYWGTTGLVRAPYNRGRTATHEIGHYFNLRHIWGDEPLCANDDGVADTPLQGPENYGCPTFPKNDACTGAPNGVMFMNYMDYSDDACMNMFTAGQVTRMYATLNGARAGLKTSNGCVPPCPPPTGLTASPVSYKTATISWTDGVGITAFTATVEYRKVGAPAWTDAGSPFFVNTVDLTGLDSATNYEYRIRSNCDTSQSNWRMGSFRTLTPSACYYYGEPNETKPTATAVSSSATINAAISTSTDNDYYKFTVTVPSHTRITLSHLPKDYDLFLYDNLGQIANSLTFGLGNEVIERDIDPGTYYVRVVGLLGDTSFSCYNLIIATSIQCQSTYDIGSNNDAVGTAPVIPVATAVTGRIDSPTDNDYYQFTTTGGGTLDLTHLPVKLDLRLLNAGGTQIGISQNLGIANESIAIPGAGTYYAHVYGFSGYFDAKNCYTLTVNAPGSFIVSSPSAESRTAVHIPVYPNPAQNVLQADLSAFEGRLQIRIVDQQGRTWLQQKVSAGTVSLGLSRLIGGLYVLQVVNEKGAMLGQEKFLKQ